MCFAYNSGMKESVDRKIPLPGVSLDTAEVFVFVLYTGSLPEDIQCQPLDHVEVLAEMMSLSHRLELYGNTYIYCTYFYSANTFSNASCILKI